MKQLIFLLTALLPLQVFANMGPPISISAGSEVGSPFLNEHVDVLHEDLHIKIGEGFHTARFKAKYHIRASKAGEQIPFLFYAADYQDSFSVTIDGKPVELKAIPPEYDIPEDTTLKDFSHFFGNLGQDGQFYIKDSLTPVIRGLYIEQDDLFYFETDLSKGEHVIKVNYEAYCWTIKRRVDGEYFTSSYSFRYALAPAKYWRSFGTLDIKLDATAYNGESLVVPLGSPHGGSVDSIARWSFDELPADFLNIHVSPSEGVPDSNEISLPDGTMPILTGFMLVLFHVGLTIWYRKRRKTVKFSKVVIINGIILPFIFLIILPFSGLSPYASISYYYYYSFSNFIFIYLVTIVLCIPFFWLIDIIVKKRLHAASYE